jgi:hypothetical protein
MLGHHIIYPFVRALYDYELSLFYNHHNREGNVTIIPFIMEIHQGDIIGATLFA